MKLVTFLKWLSPALVGVVFLVAGAGKGLNPEPTLAVLDMVGSPPLLSQIVIHLLPPLELAIGISLVVGWHSRVLMVLTLSLLGAFVGFLTRLALIDYTAVCSCYGTLIESWSGGGPLAAMGRNAVLAMLVVLPLAWPNGRVSAEGMRGTMPTTG